MVGNIAKSLEHMKFSTRELDIGSAQAPNRVILAPMSGITDAPFRRVAEELGAGLVVSEMTACAGLVRGEREATRGPVVLVHGLGASTLSWELVGPGLAERLGTSVTALDLPGFGRSRADSPATMASHRAAVTALLQAQGPAVVMGNSMGGATSVGVAARHPELVHALVLVNAAFPRPPGAANPPATTTLACLTADSGNTSDVSASQRAAAASSAAARALNL